MYALKDDTHDPYEQSVTGLILSMGHPNIYIFMYDINTMMTRRNVWINLSQLNNIPIIQHPQYGQYIQQVWDIKESYFYTTTNGGCMTICS